MWSNVRETNSDNRFAFLSGMHLFTKYRYKLGYHQLGNRLISALYPGEHILHKLCKLRKQNNGHVSTYCSETITFTLDRVMLHAIFVYNYSILKVF